ncbi:DUF294 nucleotidyltransferase-like domain-containing protein [Thiococcus pfennigii]|jgi:CBS domain-containing protein|uniref:DUF294 nucleotidyltransferase-like domain-containing protein n=1 Tax=Thiococcus pfennigii TaxID=1057 RepID=UPI00190476C2|nr:DUF294 nucleotidyltransferase-like domain-containing protein [Thiococcus pfennigii]MBK1702025.1 signal transduction protein [Thiococcus pfennigii]MBK1731210.1 signal transduction protein [Thiococcus pfennigii]
MSEIQARAAAPDTASDQVPLRALARSRPVVVAPASTVRATLQRIAEAGGDVAIVADPTSGLPLGLIRLPEMLSLIDESGGLDGPVAAAMLGAPLTIAADAPAHRARVMMAKRGVAHVLLTEPDGRLFGLVGQADLLGPRVAGAEALIGAINAARDLAAMTAAADAVRRRAAELLRSGMAVEPLCQWLSGLNDLIGMRTIELIEDEYDLPPVPWCWMVFGSEGRMEQTFATDQDNGLLFVPSAPERTEEVRQAFLPFARAVNEALHHCGFERCRGGIMAGNAACCLSAEEWQGRFAAWLRVPQPQALLNGTIFFDFRPLYGNDEPVDRLRAWLAAEAPGHDRFFRALAEQALAVAPPLGWGGRLRSDRNREHPRTIDLKVRGARLFTDAARLWALREGVWATGTADRLRAVAAARRWGGADTAAEIEAFHLVQRFRFERQLQTRDPEAANRVAPSALNELRRMMLKEALRQARRLQLRLRQEHGL